MSGQRWEAILRLGLINLFVWWGLVSGQSHYVIQPGDTLYAIAQRFDTTVEDLKMLNPDLGTVLKQGQGIALPPITYRVSEGDTLYDIARTFDTTVDLLVTLNRLDGQLIYPGQTLTISGTPPSTPEAPLVITIQPGDSLWRIARIHDLKLETLLNANTLSDTSILRVGDKLLVPGHFSPDLHDMGAGATQEMTVQKGDTLSDIAQRYNTSVSALMSANNLVETDIQIGESLRIIPLEELAPATGLNAIVNFKLAWPIQGLVTSPFGYRSLRVNGSNFHNAVDIDGITGDPVKAAAKGTVTFSGWHESYGYLVKIQADNTEFRYAHNSALLVQVGDAVDVGNTIALIGNTGLSFGDHLHFEVRVDGIPVDPLPLLANH